MVQEGGNAEVSQRVKGPTTIPRFGTSAGSGFPFCGASFQLKCWWTSAAAISGSSIQVRQDFNIRDMGDAILKDLRAIPTFGLLPNVAFLVFGQTCTGVEKRWRLP